MKKIFRLVKHLPHTMFNLMLSLSASAYVVVVFLIKEGITFSFLPQKLEYISYIIYLMAPVLVAWLCLRLSKHLSVCGMECQIEEISCLPLNRFVLFSPWPKVQIIRLRRINGFSKLALLLVKILYTT